MNKKIPSLFFLVLLLSTLPVALAADGDEELEILGLELEKLLNLGSAVVAFILASLTFAAYKRSENKRLVFIASAFTIFGIKTLLMGAELIFGEWGFVDITASILDFVILITFFLGIIKK